VQKEQGGMTGSEGEQAKPVAVVLVIKRLRQKIRLLSRVDNRLTIEEDNFEFKVITAENNERETMQREEEELRQLHSILTKATS
jgi:hypothetical protein